MNVVMMDTGATYLHNPLLIPKDAHSRAPEAPLGIRASQNGGWPSIPLSMTKTATSRGRKMAPKDHCSACQIARELATHRDESAAEWSIRRATLNFAIIIAKQACTHAEASA